MAIDVNLNNVAGALVKTAAQWVVDATVYGNRYILITSDEFFFNTDQRKFKIADGTQTWANLDYFPDVGDDVFDNRGNYDASVGTFPASGGSGTAGAILANDAWNISVAGTLGGTPYILGDTVYALVDSPGQTAGNWAKIDNAFGFTPENSANKNASGGYAGLSGFKIQAKNDANTFTSVIENQNTASRTYTLPDKDITVAGLDDISSGSPKEIIQCSGASLAPTANTTYYFSTTYSIVPTTSINQRAFTPAQDCQIQKAVIEVTQAVNALPSGLNTQFILRDITNNTDHSIKANFEHSFGTNSGARAGVTGLAINLVTGNSYEIKVIEPGFTTAPTGVLYRVRLLCF